MSHITIIHDTRIYILTCLHIYILRIYSLHIYILRILYIFSVFYIFYIFYILLHYKSISMLSKLLSSPSGKIIISAIWGFGLAALFRRACSGRSCIVYKGPNPSVIQGRTFKQGGSCYVYNTKRTNCDKVDENNVYLDQNIQITNNKLQASSK